MSRQKESFGELLFKAPWWISAAIGVMGLFHFSSVQGHPQCVNTLPPARCPHRLLATITKFIMATRRKHVLKVRFSDDEWKTVSACFPKRKVASSIRTLALGQPPPRNAPALELRRVKINALARIGNNLNQVARALNTANLVGRKVDVVQVFAKLVEIQTALENL